MAKQAKSPEVVISDRVGRSFITDIREHLANIESARGSYMNAARREREQMVSLYEALTAHGVSQKISKLTVKIATSLERIKGWQAELDEEERKIATKLAKAIGDRQQLAFWDDLKPAPKPRKAKPTNVVPMKSELNEIVDTQGAA